MDAGDEESEGSALGGGSPCGKAGLHLRPLGGLVGVDCSVCMVSTLKGRARPGFSAHQRSAARSAARARLCFIPCLQVWACKGAEPGAYL